VVRTKVPAKPLKSGIAIFRRRQVGLEAREDSVHLRAERFAVKGKQRSIGRSLA
jgi:hypothetical protein